LLPPNALGEGCFVNFTRARLAIFAAASLVVGILYSVLHYGNLELVPKIDDILVLVGSVFGTLCFLGLLYDFARGPLATAPDIAHAKQPIIAGFVSAITVGGYLAFAKFSAIWGVSTATASACPNAVEMICRSLP
jgi:hypothetical protein